MEQIKNQRERKRETERGFKNDILEVFFVLCISIFQKKSGWVLFWGVGVAEVEMTRNEREIFPLTENESIRVNERTLLKFFSAKKRRVNNKYNVKVTRKKRNLTICMDTTFLKAYEKGVVTL